MNNEIVMFAGPKFIFEFDLNMQFALLPKVKYSICRFGRINKYQINWFEKHGPIKTAVYPDRKLPFVTKLGEKYIHSDTIRSVMVLLDIDMPYKFKKPYNHKLRK